MLFTNRGLVPGIGLMIVATATASDPAGKIKEALDKAKAEYAKDQNKFHESILTWIKNREDEAFASGKLELVKAVRAEKKAFEEKGTLPGMVPIELKNFHVESRGRLQAAFVAASEAYTKARLIDEAVAVDAELKEFTKVVTPPKSKPPAAIAQPTEIKWTPLFNGTDLAGWDVGRFTHWKVENGEMVGVGKSPVGVLRHSDSRVGNFTLRVKVTPSEKEFDGVHFWFDGHPGSGFKVSTSLAKFGNLYKWGGNNTLLVQAKRPNVKEHQPNELEIQVRNRVVTIKVNGASVITPVTLPGNEFEGYLGLRPEVNSTMRVQNVELTRPDTKN